MEVSLANLTEVTGVELVHVGAVVMLTTSHTTTTGVLTVLANATVTGGNMTAAIKGKCQLLSTIPNMAAKRSCPHSTMKKNDASIFWDRCAGNKRRVHDSRFPCLGETGGHLVDGGVARQDRSE